MLAKYCALVGCRWIKWRKLGHDWRHRALCRYQQVEAQAQLFYFARTSSCSWWCTCQLNKYFDELWRAFSIRLSFDERKHSRCSHVHSFSFLISSVQFTSIVTNLMSSSWNKFFYFSFSKDWRLIVVKMDIFASSDRTWTWLEWTQALRDPAFLLSRVKSSSSAYRGLWPSTRSGSRTPILPAYTFDRPLSVLSRPLALHHQTQHFYTPFSHPLAGISNLERPAWAFLS